MNLENSKTFRPHVLMLLIDKIDLRRGEKKTLLYQILVFITYGKT